MSIEDVIIIGSGPAAYSAALFCLKHKPCLFEGEDEGGIGPGGQLTTTTDVDNYPGFPKGIQGPELMDSMRDQALGGGVRIVSKMVTRVRAEDGVFIVEDSGADTHKTRSVIVATGASAKRLYVPGTHDDEFWQKGISACAVCDGFAFKNQTVAVIGGGDAAMEETLYLSNIATRVFLIHRRDEFRARADMLAKVTARENVEIIRSAELVSADGDKVLKSLKLVNNKTGEHFSIDVDGLFFGIGHDPNVKFMNGMLELQSNGYIKADDQTRTSVPGIFACGDVQDYFYKQAVTAAASGCIAGTECSKFLGGE